MWNSVKITPNTKNGASSDVLGCFADGRMLVIYFDATAGCWMNAYDASPLSVGQQTLGLKFWKYLPDLPSSIILSDCL